MSDLNPEERYFLEKEAQIRNRIRAELEARAKAAAQRQAIAAQVGGNEQLAGRLHDLGFDADTVPALHLLPLVAVAWADGKVSPAERDAVFRIAAAHGIEPGSKAALLLASLLESRPSQAVGDQVAALLRDLLASRGLHPRSLVEASLEVASASGGFLGLGNKVGPQERALIEDLSRTFSQESRDRVIDRLG